MKIVNLPLTSRISGLLILFGAALVLSCNSKPELTTHIPKNASVIMTADVKSMAVKSLDFGKIFSLENLKKAVGGLGKKKDTTSASIADSGIDLAGKFYIFGVTSETIKYGAVTANLSDSKKFEEFIKKSDKSITVTEEGKMKFASFSDGKGVIGWNADEVYIIFGAENAKETLIALSSLKVEESIAAGSTSFKETQKESADISLWINFEELAKTPEYNAAVGSVNLKDSYLSAICNFEDGQIVVDTKYVLNSELTEKYNFIKANVGTDVVNTLPGKSVIGLIGLAFDMEKIYDRLEKENLVSAYGPIAQQTTGLSMKDLLTMLSGDMAVTLNGIEVKAVVSVDPMGQPRTRKQPQPDYSVVLGIASKEKLDQLLGQLAKTAMLTKKDGYYTYQDKVFVIEKGATVVITGTESRMQSIKKGNGDKMDTDLVTMLSSTSTSFYLNLTNIPETAYSDGGEEVGEKIKQSEVESVTITSSAIKDNVSVAKMVVKFRVKNENALITLARVSKKFSDARNQATIEEPTEGTEEIQIDSTSIN